MNKVPPHPTGRADNGGAFKGSGRATFGQGSASAMGMKWAALHDAAGTVALIAAMEAPAMSAEVRSFPAAIREAGGKRLRQAEQGIEDISAIMEPGLSALLAAHSRGANPQAAACALWNEFVGARDALLALVPPEDERRTLRFT